MHPEFCHARSFSGQRGVTYGRFVDPQKTDVCAPAGWVGARARQPRSSSAGTASTARAAARTACALCSPVSPPRDRGRWSQRQCCKAGPKNGRGAVPGARPKCYAQTYRRVLQVAILVDLRDGPQIQGRARGRAGGWVEESVRPRLSVFPSLAIRGTDHRLQVAVVALEVAAQSGQQVQKVFSHLGRPHAVDAQALRGRRRRRPAWTNGSGRAGRARQRVRVGIGRGTVVGKTTHRCAQKVRAAAAGSRAASLRLSSSTR